MFRSSDSPSNDAYDGKMRFVDGSNTDGWCAVVFFVINAITNACIYNLLHCNLFGSRVHYLVAVRYLTDVFYVVVLLQYHAQYRREDWLNLPFPGKYE